MRPMMVNVAKLCTGAWSAVAPRGLLLRSTFVAASGQAFGYVVSFLAMPLLTRLYSPADFGAFNVYLSMVSVLGACATLRYDAAIPLAKSERNAMNIFALSVFTALAASLVSSVVLLMLASFTALRTPLIIVVLAIHVFCFGCFASLSSWIVRRKAFHWLSLARFLQNVSCVAGQLVLAWFARSAESLAVGAAIGCLMGVVTASWCCRVLRRFASKVTVRRLKYVAVRYHRFPLMEAPSVLIYAAAMGLPSILFTAYYGSEVAGWFGLGGRVLSMPLMLLGLAASRVYTAQAAECMRTGSTALPALFRRTVRRLLLLAGPAVLAAGLVCPFFFPVVFGKQWAEAGIYCMLITPWTIAHLLATVLFGTVNIIERQQLTFLGSGLFAMILASGLVAPNFLGLSPRMAVAVLAMSGTLGSSLMVWIAWRAVQSAAGKSKT